MLRKYKYFIAIFFAFILIFLSWDNSYAGCSGSWTCGMIIEECPYPCTTTKCNSGADHCAWVSGCENDSVPFKCEGTTQAYCLNDANCGYGYCSGPNNESCSWSAPSPPPSPSVPFCTFLSWTSSICGGGFCNPEERLYTAIYDPPHCDSNTKCVADPTCLPPLPPPPPPPPPGCVFDHWETGECNTVACSPGERYYLAIYNPPGCDSSVKCQADPICSLSGCEEGIWQKLGCGPRDCGYLTCPEGYMCQEKTYSPAGCYPDQYVCHFDPVNCPIASSVCDIGLSDVTLDGTDDTYLSIVQINVESGSSIDKVDFYLAGTGIASLSTSSDSSPAFQTEVKAESIGSEGFSAVATMDDGTTCSATANITVGNPKSWFQIKEGDIIADGDVSSSVPSDEYMIIYDPLPLPGESPGIVAVSGSILEPDVSIISDPGWYVVNDTYAGKEYKYAYFEKLASHIGFHDPGVLIGDVSDFGAVGEGGYRWAKHSGDVSVNTDINIGSNKVVLFVDGDLLINGKINVGTGFFMAIVSENIEVDPAVGGAADSDPDIEGLYFTDGTFKSGNDPVDGEDEQLHVRGTVAVGGFDLQRNLADNSLTPAEYFEFAPDQTLQVPAALSKKMILWREVAP